jgi:hypothetical protein
VTGPPTGGGNQGSSMDSTTARPRRHRGRTPARVPVRPDRAVVPASVRAQARARAAAAAVSLGLSTAVAVLFHLALAVVG